MPRARNSNEILAPGYWDRGGRGKPISDWLRESVEESEMTVRCAVPGCRFEFAGEFAEARKRHHEHRSKKHPEMVPRRRSRKAPSTTEKPRQPDPSPVALSRDEVIAGLRRFEVAEGRLPTTTDLQKSVGRRLHGAPAYWQIGKVFGSYPAALEAAFPGREPPRKGPKKKAGGAE